MDTPNSNLSVAEFFETVYLPYVKTNRTPSTYESARRYWTYLKDHFNGSKTLASYQPWMGSQLLLKLRDEGYSANTVKNVLASAIFAHALGTGHLRLADGADKKTATRGQQS